VREANPPPNTRAAALLRGHTGKTLLRGHTGKTPLREAELAPGTVGHPRGHAHGPRPRPCAYRSERQGAAVPVPSPELPGPARTPGFLPGLPIRFRPLSPLSGYRSSRPPSASSQRLRPAAAQPFAPAHSRLARAPRSLRGGPLGATRSWTPALLSALSTLVLLWLELISPRFPGLSMNFGLRFIFLWPSGHGFLW
jgi:hypothetical protein